MKETIEEVAETIAKGFGSENWQEIKDGIIRYAVDEKQQENNFFESLQKYFKETPREKVLEDWAKSAEFDNVSSDGESIEEAAEKYARAVWGFYYDDVHPEPNITLTLGELSVKDFSGGAKYQAEKMYSEKEVRDLFNLYKEEFSIYRNSQILNVQFEEWFNENKKQQ
jgi:hypothetical protein